MPPFSRRPNPDDPQRERVYAAERAVGFPRANEFPTLREVRAFVAEVLATPTWAALARHTRAEGAPVEVRRGRGTRSRASVPAPRRPGWQEPRIWIAPHGRRRWTVLHELAHCARGRLTLNHGPQFTASYVRLVRDCWDPALADRLQAAFAERGVRVAAWAAPDVPVPVPDPATLDDLRDEGLAEEAAWRAAQNARAIQVLRQLADTLRARGEAPAAASFVAMADALEAPNGGSSRTPARA